MTDYAALREAAEKATGTKWESTDGVVWIDTRKQVCCGRGQYECCGEPDVIGGQEKIAEASIEDAAFIALANPTTVLSLLDALAASEATLLNVRQILAGTNVGSLPNDYPIERLALETWNTLQERTLEGLALIGRAEAAEAKLEKAREALERIDRRGGLGYDVHNLIAITLKDIA